MIKADVVVVGGGAAGFFTAVNAAENNPDLKIMILERGKEVLTKVKISGGGRCNVTHAEFLPKELAQNYPRGQKELLGPFHTFMTGDTIDWFENRGVELKTEEDGRMFPVTDLSQTIIDCLCSEAQKHGVEVMLGQAVREISKEEGFYSIATSRDTFSAKTVVVSSGSNPKIWKILESLGHTIVPPVPSLFTFNIKDPRIDGLAGIATHARVRLLNSEGKTLLEDNGPLLITHWGMSGPAVLKLSAWGARILEPLKYQFKIEVNWLDNTSEEEVLEELKSLKSKLGKQTIFKHPQFGLPKRLWQGLLISIGIGPSATWAEATRENLHNIANQVTAGIFEVNGKSTFKEEFVTAGGVNLKEINFKTFESKIVNNLFFAGEVMDVDAITGGFNFQNAWTSGFIVAQNISL